jgi:hemerythrin-like metal-binding protein
VDESEQLRKELREAHWRAERAQKVAVIALADLAEHRDRNTGEHVLRVARLTHEMARMLDRDGQLSATQGPDFISYLGTASILHDVGKIGVPDSILLKPGALTASERRTMERHASEGGAILRKAGVLLAGSRQFLVAAEIAVCHHERWDGRGYPNKLAGAAIPLAARIVAVADVFDALTSERPYKKAWSHEEGLNYVLENAGSQFDPVIAAALADVLEARGQARTIAWTPQMEIGHALIDHDHRNLLDLINQVSTPTTQHDPVALEFVLDELLSYTAYHFLREEELMRVSGFPGLTLHGDVHARMIDEVRALLSRLMDPDDRLGEELHEFLGRWLIEHIMGEDRRYIPYVCDC